MVVRFRAKELCPTDFQDDRPFIQAYLEVIRDRESPEKAAEWLFVNYSRMNSGIFSKSGWENIGPLELLILRACSPAGVFTLPAKYAFLTNIQDNQQLCQIAEIAFGISDSGFLLNLPKDFKQYQPKLRELMRIAYKNDIRVEDPKVSK